MPVEREFCTGQAKDDGPGPGDCTECPVSSESRALEVEPAGVEAMAVPPVELMGMSPCDWDKFYAHNRRPLTDVSDVDEEAFKSRRR